MLLVNARAGFSQIHGIGLIAQEFIPKGAKIWVLQLGFDLVIPEEELPGLSEPARKQVVWYAYFDSALNAFVLSGDDDRFTNHSDNPNTASGDDCTYAMRDIQAGEEITWCYRDWSKADFLLPSELDFVQNQCE